MLDACVCFDRSHNFSDPLLFDSLIRRFHTPAEREAEGQRKGYSRTLETSLLRGEARLASLAKSPGDGTEAEANKRQSQSPDRGFGGASSAGSFVGARDVRLGFESETSREPESREEGQERWEEFLRVRFIQGEDEDFEYRIVDENDEFDALERRDQEDAWFDDEDPDWASIDEGDGHTSGGRGGTRIEKILTGETGLQDF